mmetsp:Transcript_10370/g.30454  ORF Transcript_10370/g.30454 Transcript_10370/m.30454 type:complete len:134 (-) Transcript_10370:232-633(-)
MFCSMALDGASGLGHAFRQTLVELPDKCNKTRQLTHECLPIRAEIGILRDGNAARLDGTGRVGCVRQAELYLLDLRVLGRGLLQTTSYLNLSFLVTSSSAGGASFLPTLAMKQSSVWPRKRRYWAGLMWHNSL